MGTSPLGNEMLARLSFRSKLFLVASIPLVALLVFAGFTINGRVQRLDRAEQYGDIVGPYQALNAASRGISDEAVVSAWYLGQGDPEAKQLLADTRDRTNRAVSFLDDSVANLNGRVKAGTERAVRDVLERLQGLDDIRAEVDAGTNRDLLLREIGRSTLDAASRVARDTYEQRLATGLSSIVDLRRQQAAVGDEGVVVMNALVTGAPIDRAAWTVAITEQEVQLERFISSASEPIRKAYAAWSADAPTLNPVRDEDEPGQIPESFDPGSTTPTEYVDWYTGRQARLDGGVDVVQRVVNNAAAAFEADTRTETLIIIGVTALVILIVLIGAWRVARSVNRPLRALTRAARDVSERRLPALVDTLGRGGELTPGQLEELTPIRVESRDEIGELAQAFNTIQQVTVRVAEEQSELLKKGIGDLYVNLARRNQSLLDRQISLLDDMEATVEDPGELGSLFELDHLATRMRRNAESLLVMSGAGQPRQWGTAIPVVDVVRAAAAEIADFPRVVFHGFEGDVAVVGNAVADLTHLLAELLENATAFSPPETEVVVAGQAVDRRFVITVTDQGIGMEDERMQQANALLARPPAPGLALARTLGLYVVGHLASRYGIHVQLRRGTRGGLTAVVVIPATSLARPGEPDAASDPVTPREAPVRAEPVMSEPMPSTEAVIAAPPPPTSEPVAAPPPPSHQPMPAPQPVVQPRAPEPVAAADAPVNVAPAAPAERIPQDPITWRLGDPIPAAAAPTAAPPTAPPVPPMPMAEPQPPMPTTEPQPPMPMAAPQPPMAPQPFADERLTRRVATPAPAPNGGNGEHWDEDTGDGNGNGLTSRVPGTSLTHEPTRATAGPGDVRPRPERVHDMLTRHERGKRDGRVRAPDTPASAEVSDPGRNGRGPE